MILSPRHIIRPYMLHYDEAGIITKVRTTTVLNLKLGSVGITAP
jgi:hypothetical protein